MTERRWIAALAFAGLAVVALGFARGEADTSARTIEIDIHHSHFTPGSITVAAGVPVTFVLVNTDPIDHEWIVGDEATHQRHRTGTEPTHGARPTEQSIAAGQTVRTTVTFQSPGTFQYICHLPGHEAYGMVGTVTVTGG
jgi:uncharacterized cupredoxin-like copper-binding protein